MKETIFDGANGDCFIHKFSVNGIDADESDFGETEFNGGKCYCEVVFVPSSIPEDTVLKKYGITKEEFFDIAKTLEKKISIGYCDQCI